MFERELIDSMFVQRWGIVRTLMPQSVAEHTFLVTHYVNDLCVFFKVSSDIHLAALQAAIWHDAKDEIFTGDLPGPNKRGLLDAIGPDAKKKWNTRLQEWAERTFKALYHRSGGHVAHNSTTTGEVIELLLKTADWLEAATRMATENQMGNQCAHRHIGPNLAGALETAAKLCEALTGEKVDRDNIPFQPNRAEVFYFKLEQMLTEAVTAAHVEQSIGPWITKEDENRGYHDPCVDTPLETEPTPRNDGEAGDYQ